MTLSVSDCSKLYRFMGSEVLVEVGKELASLKKELSKKEFRAEVASYKGVRQLMDWAIVFGLHFAEGGADFPAKLFQQKHIAALAAEFVDDEGEVQAPMAEAFLGEFQGWMEHYLDDHTIQFSKKKADVAFLCDDFLNKIRKGWWNSEALATLRKARVHRDYKDRVKEAAELIAGDDVLGEVHVTQAIKEVAAELPKLELGTETIEIKIDEPATLPLPVVGELIKRQIDRHANKVDEPVVIEPEKPVAFAPQLSDARILQLERRIEELQGRTSLDADIICSLKEQIRELQQEAAKPAKKDLASLIKDEVANEVAKPSYVEASGQMSLLPVAAPTPALAACQVSHSAPMIPLPTPALTDEEATLSAEAMGLRLGEIYQVKSNGLLLKVKKFYANKAIVMVAGEYLDDGAAVQTRADWLLLPAPVKENPTANQQDLFAAIGL